MIPAICLILACPPPAVPDKPLTFNMPLNIHKDCKIYVEMPVPEIRPSYKALNKEQLRKNLNMLMFQEYMVKKIIVEEMQIIELHFRLMRPEDRVQEPKKNEVAEKPK